jgi:ribonuclease HI
VEIHPEHTVVIYTDGSQLAKPRRGGFGVVLLWTNDEGREEEYLFSPPGYTGVTIPQMELKAVIEGVKLLLRKPPIVPPHLFRKVWIYADALYVVDGHPLAKWTWSTGGWRNKNGAPVENATLWKELLKLERRLGKPVEIHKVKGHGSNPHNRTADQLAKTSAKGGVQPPLIPGKVRRKKSSKRLRRGTVPIEGQTLAIHVHKGEFMALQNVNQFESSVQTPGPHFEEIVLVTASTDLNIREGYTYLVRLNDDPKHPQISEVLMEVIEGKKDESADSDS